MEGLSYAKYNTQTTRNRKSKSQNSFRTGKNACQQTKTAAIKEPTADSKRNRIRSINSFLVNIKLTCYSCVSFILTLGEE